MMQRNRILLFVLFAGLVGALALAAAQENAEQTPSRPKPESSEVVVPADTTIPLALRNTINSRTAFVGQGIYCETIYPITVGNRIVIPVGSYVKGTVTQVIRPGRVKGKAQLGIRFESLTLPNGTTRMLRATLSAYAGKGNQGFIRGESRIEGESSKGKDTGKVATSGTQGAIVGAIAGRSAKGAGIGAAAGGVGGLILVLATRGKEIVLPPGTNLDLQLSAPLSFQRDEVEPSSRYSDGPALPQRDYGPGS
jgi:type IV secretion system protein VirB10